MFIELFTNYSGIVETHTLNLMTLLTIFVCAKEKLSTINLVLQNF